MSMRHQCFCFDYVMRMLSKLMSILKQLSFHYEGNHTDWGQGIQGQREEYTSSHFRLSQPDKYVYRAQSEHTFSVL